MSWTSNRAVFAGALALAASIAMSALVAGAPARPIARRASKGTVAVLYAGSLVAYMEDQFGPAFERSSGYAFRGFGGGSTEDASEIKGGARVGDVFVSALGVGGQAARRRCERELGLVVLHLRRVATGSRL